ncbi:MAG TPA: ZIP family metal transporter [Cryomorphaceae bacterium]|nr:ZIP family metal transporter [Cryomorphaceae bacterium]
MIWTALIISVGLGAGAAWIIPIDSRTFKYLLAFSGAFLFGTLLTHMIPEVFHDGAVKMGWWIMLGFGVQLMLDYLSEGLEHGHFHSHGNTVPWLAMVGLLLHAFIEGMPLNHNGVNGHDHSQGTFLWAIALHKLPIALLVTGALRKAQVPLQTIGLIVVFFALATPLGSTLGNVTAIVQYAPEMLAVAIGLLLHVSTTILFESSQNHQFNLIKLIFVVAGMALAAWMSTSLNL